MINSDVATGLDVGSGSIKTLIVQKVSPETELEILVKDQRPSTGLRKGVVVDVAKVENIIQASFEEAQTRLDQKINSVYTNIGGSHIFSAFSRGLVSVSRADKKISQEDIERVLENARTFSLPTNNEILDVFPKEYIVDGEAGVREAVGMTGVRLEAEILAVCGFSPYIKNLTEAVLNTGVQIDSVVPSVLAAAKAVLTPRQKELGVVLVDIGAGNTQMAVFEEGELLNLAVFPIGGAHISNDIAIGLCTDIDIAEKIKKRFGTCCESKTKKMEKIETLAEPLTFSQKMLVKIIEARVVEIFEQVQKELKKISRQGLLPAGVVLTGGGANLPKIVELAKKELKLPTQIGVPRGFLGLEPDPALATVCGLAMEGINSTNTGGRFPNLGTNAGSVIKRILKIFIP
ncbi:cell division protein FtsA [Candidatus Parcubacteria bacterium]|nr:cell division protein FtsA [Candidatus Parcubacteria bacterium]